MRGYKSTLECFEKEDNYKNLDKKNKDLLSDEKQSKFTKLIAESKERTKTSTFKPTDSDNPKQTGIHSGNHTGILSLCHGKTGRAGDPADDFLL